MDRRAIVVVPEDYAPDPPHMLVFGFHGRTNDTARARRYFGLERVPDQHAIFVYPAGVRDDGGRFTWSDPGDPPDALRDFALFDVILERLSHSYCIDLDAVFVVGHSLGATFANSLACARADRIRGLASVAGGIDPAKCRDQVAALLLHNARDQAVPVSEGRRARDVLLGEVDDHAQPASGRLGSFECRRYGDDEAPILWCLHGQHVTHTGRFYPHQWPRGAAEAIMRFFSRLAN